MILLVLLSIKLYHLIYIVLIWLVGSSIFLFDVTFLGSIHLFDFFIRTLSNDSIVNYFNFIWTSVLYLPTLYLTLTIVTILKSKVYRGFILLLTLTLAYFLWTLFLGDFLFINTPIIGDLYGFSDVNILLWNNLNKYHPLLLYFSAWSVFYIFINFKFIFVSHERYQVNLLLNHLLKTFKSSANLSLFALFLGGWWAIQEGTWGGWWNWDSSEVLGMIIYLILLTLFHVRSNFYSFKSLLAQVTFYLLILILSYFLIQLSFELTSHNFGTRFRSFFNLNLFFISMLTIFIYFIFNLLSLNYWLLTHYSTLWTRVNFTTNLGFLKLSLLLIFLYTVGVILVSFNPLINYFLWTFLSINSFNYPLILLTLVYLGLIIFIQILLPIRYVNFVYILPLFILPYFELYNTLLLYSIFFSTVGYRMHFLGSLFVVLNLITYQTSLTYWTPSSLYFTNFTGSQLFFYVNSGYICNSYFIDQSLLYIDSKNLFLNSTNTFYHSSSLTLNNFLLISSSDQFSNIFYNSFHWLQTSLYSEILFLNNLLGISFLFILYFYWNIKFNTKVFN